MLGPLYRLADRARDRARRRTWDPDLAAGRRGEDIAHRFLQRAGMTVVARNHRTPTGSGEVDLVAWDDLPKSAAIVVAVSHREFKSRKTADFLSKLENDGVITDVKSMLDPADFAASNVAVWRL